MKEVSLLIMPLLTSVQNTDISAFFETSTAAANALTCPWPNTNRYVKDNVKAGHGKGAQE